MNEPTLRTLLRRRDLRLRLVSAEDTLREDGIDHPLRWVHSSDLADPTPFLADDLLLLTTGTQLADDDPEGTAAYVARLVERGVAALGFGTEVQRDGIPDLLASACAERGLPLFEVPYDTPFIAVARAHAEAIAAQAYARRTWALEAQRALAVAALRPRGLEATVSELARRLERWVGLFDATGALAHEHPQSRFPARSAAALAARTTELITRGGQAGQSLQLDGESFMLFTLGHSGHLRGTIAIASAGLDPEERTVVTSVIAMAGLALEQNEKLAQVRRRLDTQVLSSLLLDDPALARGVLGTLPPAPIVIAVADAHGSADAVIDWSERLRAERRKSAFVAMGDEGLVLCVSADEDHLVDEVAARFGIRIGVSEPVGYDAFSHAHAQALHALRHRTDRTTEAARYGDIVSSSIFGALATDEARLVAESRLAPLRADDARTGGHLERSLRLWLEHDAHAERAAESIGVHRHTLRTRIARAAALLDMDLSSFAARAELWTLLQTASPA